MAKIINEVTIVDEFDQWGVRYPDGEIMLVGNDQEGLEAAEAIVRCCLVIAPDADYEIQVRTVFVGDWEDPGADSE